MTTVNLAILGSTRGTVMLGIIDAIGKGELAANINIVISNRSDAPILTRAQDFGLRTLFLDPQNQTREAYDVTLSEALKKHQIDLVLLIGYMRILTPTFVRKWHKRVMNIHPSLLPEFGGRMDHDVYQAVLNAKKTETGCTVHYVTADVDAGPIVLQKRCLVAPYDTVDSLKARVQKLEKVALVEAIAGFLKQSIQPADQLL